MCICVCVHARMRVCACVRACVHKLFVNVDLLVNMCIRKYSNFYMCIQKYSNFLCV
jgi:hypothetical protein